MMSAFDEQKYEFVLAGDEPHEGMALELWEGETLILLAFRSDNSDSFTFTAFRENLPFALVEAFVHSARESLIFPEQKWEPLD